ncbi:SSI family serine proteinase inhibitor [Actinosynnema sp. NPDC020468]|uniref:SSI family serine proteinase inhibitor n=1 Tax=Actinosynnema sp. NPDC020468 TaxID=3154488 RepID=UPI0033C61EF4
MRVRSVLTALCAAVCAAVLTPPAAVGSVTVNEYTLTLSGFDHTWSRAIRLRCPAGPEGHYHPRGEQACADLAGVRGNLDRMRPSPTRCAPEYGRLVATLSGSYAGRSVGWNRAFRDECTLYTATHAVFRF